MKCCLLQESLEVARLEYNRKYKYEQKTIDF